MEPIQTIPVGDAKELVYRGHPVDDSYTDGDGWFDLLGLYAALGFAVLLAGLGSIVGRGLL